MKLSMQVSVGLVSACVINTAAQIDWSQTTVVTPKEVALLNVPMTVFVMMNTNVQNFGASTPSTQSTHILVGIAPADFFELENVRRKKPGF